MLLVSRCDSTSIIHLSEANGSTMSSPIRLVLFALATLVVAPFFIACSSSPDQRDDTPIELSAAEDLIQTPDVLLAARVDLDGLSELTPTFQRLAQSSGSPEFRDLADISPDPIGHLAELHDIPNELPALDRDRPSYVLISNKGNLEFFRAAMLGLPTEPDEWPRYLNFRVLLPTLDSEALSRELRPWLDELTGDEYNAYQIFDESGFVRVELAIRYDERTLQGEGDAEQWLQGLNPESHGPPASADFRATPAYNAFLNRQSSFAVWAPAEALTFFATLEAYDGFVAEYDIVSSLGKSRFFLTGVAQLALPSTFYDAVSAEHEDLSLIFGHDDSDAIFIDLYATRTSRGARIHHAATEPVALPGLGGNQSFLRIDWQADVEAIRGEMDKPHWTTIDDAIDGDNLSAQLQGGSQGSHADGPSGLSLVAMAAQYPWTAFAISSENLDDFVPMPRALSMEAFMVEEGYQQIPIGAVAVAAFANGPETRAAIEQMLMLGDTFAPGVFDAELVDRDDGLLELRLAVNTELSTAFDRTAPPRQIGSTEFSLDLGAIQNFLMAVPAGQAASLFDKIHLRSLGETNYQALRLTLGTDQGMAPAPVESTVELLDAPTSRCRTELAGAAVEHLSDLRGDSVAKVEAWARAVNELASRCIEPNHQAADLIEKRVDLARETAAEIP